MWHKKGVSTLEETVGHILLALFLIVALAGAIFRISDNAQHLQEVTAREIALAHDALQVAPNQISYKYNIVPELSVKKTGSCTIEVSHTKQQFPVKIPCSTIKEDKTTIETNQLNICTLENQQQCPK